MEEMVSLRVGDAWHRIRDCGYEIRKWGIAGLEGGFPHVFVKQTWLYTNGRAEKVRAVIHVSHRPCGSLRHSPPTSYLLPPIQYI